MEQRFLKTLILVSKEMIQIPSKIIGSSDIQSVTIKSGNYTIDIDDTFNYKLLMSSGCSGIMSKSSIKECVLTLDDQPIVHSQIKLNNEMLSTNNLTNSENTTISNMESNNLTKFRKYHH